ncbi:hypothetical protein MKW98_010754 [Papaver atlanticum]|uniref:Uncharacterized protein n=1 Tax=Papaver atlanticum TaxID=357466 RepID=A0AAD4XG32_9MAGN|nr:hypothetical protein MKW98_010754 [Papaver atlanticum]
MHTLSQKTLIYIWGNSNFSNAILFCMKPVEEYLNAIDAVTLDDIASVAQRIISSPMTMASHGKVPSLESYDTISRRFN